MKKSCTLLSLFPTTAALLLLTVECGGFRPEITGFRLLLFHFRIEGLTYKKFFLAIGGVWSVA